MNYEKLLFGINYKDFSNLPKIYYINLKRSIDRNNYIINHFEEYNITNYERIEGEDYKNNNINFIKSKKKKFNDAEYYCLFSHIKVLRNFINNTEYNEIMVCEDDISFNTSKYFNNNIIDYLKYKPSDYDIINLVNSKQINIGYEKINDEIYYFTCCYLISRKGAEKILNKFDKLNYNFSNVDFIVADRFLYYDIENENNKMKYYMNGLFKLKDNNDSLIHPEHLKIHNKINNTIELFFIDYKLYHYDFLKDNY